MGTVLVETGLPGGRSREMWVCLDSVAPPRAVALRLVGEFPARTPRREGLWVFFGSRFARVIGLPRGHGPVGGTCCESLEKLQRARGAAAVQMDLSLHYEAIVGTTAKPGKLDITQQAWLPQAGTFFDAAAGIGGEMLLPSKLGGELVHRMADGREQRWQVLEWGFDPFTPEGKQGPLEVECDS